MASRTCAVAAPTAAATVRATHLGERPARRAGRARPPPCRRGSRSPPLAPVQVRAQFALPRIGVARRGWLPGFASALHRNARAPVNPDADRGPRTTSAPAAGPRTSRPAGSARGGARTQPRRTDGMIDEEETHQLVASLGAPRVETPGVAIGESRSSTTAAHRQRRGRTPARGSPWSAPPTRDSCPTIPGGPVKGRRRPRRRGNRGRAQGRAGRCDRGAFRRRRPHEPRRPCGGFGVAEPRFPTVGGVPRPRAGGRLLWPLAG